MSFINYDNIDMRLGAESTERLIKTAYMIKTSVAVITAAR
jgi:hypothetical protein